MVVRKGTKESKRKTTEEEMDELFKTVDFGEESEGEIDKGLSAPVTFESEVPDMPKLKTGFVDISVSNFNDLINRLNCNGIFDTTAMIFNGNGSAYMCKGDDTLARHCMLKKGKEDKEGFSIIGEGTLVMEWNKIKLKLKDFDSSAIISFYYDPKKKVFVMGHEKPYKQIYELQAQGNSPEHIIESQTYEKEEEDYFVNGIKLDTKIQINAVELRKPISIILRESQSVMIPIDIKDGKLVFDLEYNKDGTKEKFYMEIPPIKLTPPNSDCYSTYRDGIVEVLGSSVGEVELYISSNSPLMVIEKYSVHGLTIISTINNFVNESA